MSDYATMDEATIREVDDDEPTLREYFPPTPSMRLFVVDDDAELTIEDLTPRPLWSSSPTRPMPN